MTMRAHEISAALGIKALAAALLLVLLSVLTGQAQTDYVGGHSTATRITEPGLRGYWRYCITVSWDVSQYPEGAHGASHLSIVLGLDECIGYCGESCFMFPDTVGVGGGVDGCDVYYYAELDIRGDPTIPPTISTIKFEPYYSDCEPDEAGAATVCFYSLFPPLVRESQPGSIWIKFGVYTEEGQITGMLPSCSTAASESSSWGSIKRLFR